MARSPSSWPTRCSPCPPRAGSKILGCLLGGPLAVGEITSALGMEQSAVSHQLRVLRDHSLVRVERDGKRRLYAVYDEAVRDLLDAALRHVQRRQAHRGRSSGTAVGG